MAYAQSDIDALESAIASGVLQVRHGETSTTYHSLDEMKANPIRDEARCLRRRRSLASFSKGV